MAWRSSAPLSKRMLKVIAVREASACRPTCATSTSANPIILAVRAEWVDARHDANDFNTKTQDKLAPAS